MSPLFPLLLLIAIAIAFLAAAGFSALLEWWRCSLPRNRR